MSATIVLLKGQQFGDRFFHHGDEIPPGLIDGELLDSLIDQKLAVETANRRSLYKLFAPFSGCTETERLSTEELASALTE